MIRLLIRIAIFFAAAAVGLLIASLLFDGFEISAVGFIIDAAIYGIVLGLLSPLFSQQAERSRSTLLSGGVGVVTVLVALVVTDLLSDSLTISGIGTWIGATVVVWLATLVAAFLLPVLFVKDRLDDRR